MPEYHKVIAVDGTEFQEIVKIFSDLVHDKFYKSVPYRDYTQLRKYCGEVEFRFADDGAVIVVPTESGKSLLWWGKKDDNSFGTFLWGHFQEELQKMHEESKVIDNCYKYDFHGSYDGCTAKSVIDDICSSYDWSGLTLKTDSSGATHATVAGDAYSTAVTGWVNISDTVEQLKARVEELGKMVQDSTAGLHEEVQEIARTSVKSLEEAYEEMEAKLSKKIDISEMEYRLEDRMMDVYAEIDEARYDTKMLRDRVCELEDNCKTADNETPTRAGIVYDMYGVPHEIQGVSTQSTSSPNYPVKNYKLNLKADFMAGNDRKEKESMDTAKMFNFDFGPVDAPIRMSPYGLAIRNAEGKYVSYDKETASVMDVEIFNFDAQKFLYKMPVAVNQVAVGDIVVHMRKPMFVRAVKDGVVSVIDIYNAEAKDILPVKSPFGFNFITKVVSLIDMTGANTNSPFGNMWPLLMLGEGQNFKDILPMMLFANGSLGNVTQNPLMMYALMKDGDGIGDVLPFLMLGQNGLFGATAEQKCDCGCHNHGENHQ